MIYCINSLENYDIKVLKLFFEILLEVMETSGKLFYCLLENKAESNIYAPPNTYQTIF